MEPEAKDNTKKSIYVQETHVRLEGEGVRRFSAIFVANMIVYGLVGLIAAWSAFQAEWAAKQASLDVWVIINLESIMMQHNVPVPECLKMNGLGQLPEKEDCK